VFNENINDVNDILSNFLYLSKHKELEKKLDSAFSHTYLFYSECVQKTAFNTFFGTFSVKTKTGLLHFTYDDLELINYFYRCYNHTKNVFINKNDELIHSIKKHDKILYDYAKFIFTADKKTFGRYHMISSEFLIEFEEFNNSLKKSIIKDFEN
jgi:hypothetical protein